MVPGIRCRRGSGGKGGHAGGDGATRLQPDRRRGPAGGGTRAGGRRLVPHPDPAQAAEGADAAQGRPGDPRHPDLVRRLRRHRRAWLALLGHLVGGALLLRLWRALRLVLGFALARMRPRHRLQDALDERRRLPDRLLHGAARADGLALEPYPPPHRHHHRRPRPRDRRAAAARYRSASSSTSSPSRAAIAFFGKLLLHTTGRLAADEATYIPESERGKVYRRRAHLGARSTRPSSRPASTGGTILPAMLRRACPASTAPGC